MLNVTRSPLLRYGVAVLAVGLALLLQTLLVPWFGVEPDASPFKMFFAAVVVAAFFGGLGPGLLATVLSALASHYFFLSPQYAFQIDGLGQSLRLTTFVLEAAFISLLVAALRSARRRADDSARQARDDRARMHESEERYRFLADAGAALSSSLDYRETLSRVARLAVPRLADWCAVDVLSEEDGSLERLAVAHADFEKVGLAYELHERYPTDPDAPRGVHRVLRTGEPEMMAEIPAEFVEEAARDERHREILRELGLRSYMVVPLVTRGKTLGAITLATAESGRRYGETDLELAEELARRAAMAVDNTWLYEEAKREIAEREQAQEELRSSRDQLEIILYGVADGITAQDESGLLVYANEAAARICGYPSARALLEAPPQEVWQKFEITDESGRPFPLDRLPGRRALRGERSTEVLLRFREVSTGEERWSALDATPVSDERGNVRFVVNIFRDVTELKRTEEEKARQARQASFRADVSTAFAEGGPLRSTLQRCTEAMVRHLDAAFARVWTLNEEEDVLELQASAGMYTHLDGTHSRVPVGRFKIGLIAQERSPRLTNDVIHDPRVHDKKWAMREGMVSFAGYPLVVENRLVGVMAMFARQALTQDTIEAMASVADAVAQGIERKRAEEELIERRRQLKDLVGKLLTAQEEERRKIAYEIHDGLTQIAVAVHQRLQAFADDHPPGSKVREGELDRLLALARETVKESRRVIEGLRPTALDEFGLATALRMQVEQIEKSGALQIGYEDDLRGERLPAEVETALYRVAQEALTNVRKHAQTESAHVAIEGLPGKVRLKVSDEGRGFDPSAETASEGGGGPGERMGLTSMQERVSLLGGEFRIRSRPGAGTSVIAEVPLPASSEE